MQTDSLSVTGAGAICQDKKKKKKEEGKTDVPA